MWDDSSGESRGGAGAGPTAITGLQLEGRVGPGTDALSRSRSGTSNGSGGAGGAAINGHGQGGSGGAGAVGAGVGGAIGRRTSSLKTTGSPQKKLTPPPQLGERNLLRSGSVSVSASLSSVTGSVTREREGHLGGAHPYHRQSSTSTSQQPQPQHQHHTSTSTSSSTTTQQIRVHLRGGGSAGPHQPQQYQPVQPYQYQVPGRERGPPPAPTSGAASRSRDTIANYNRLRRETQHSSTSTLHHQNYWPDNFRNPRGGLGIEHSNNATRSNSIATNPRDDNQPRTGGIQKLALEESGVAEDTLDDLLPPRNLYKNHSDNSGIWRPASSIYSDGDNYTSPISPNFANVAARNTYTSAVADISPPSSPDMEAHRDGTPTQGRGNVSPMDESPDMSQLDINGAHHQAQQKRNIPMMRRERRKNQEAAAAHTLRETKSQQRLRIQRETKWDDMTGEPTSRTTGRAGQVRPQEYAQEFGANSQFGKSPAAMRAMQNAPQAQQTFGDRLRRLRPVSGSPKQQQQQQQPPQQSPPQASTAPDVIDERPPWRGASGRAPIVSPVRDTKPAAPLNIPPKGTRRAAVGPRLPIAGVNSPLSPVSPSGSETSPRSRTPTIRTVFNAPRQLTTASNASSPTAARTPPPAQSAYPSPPNSGAGVQSPVHATPEATNDANVTKRQPPSLTGLPAAPNAHVGLDKALRRKPPPTNSHALHAPQPSYSSSVYSEQTVHAPASTHERSPPRAPAAAQREAAAAAKQTDPWAQPPSRFSVTTYATSADPDTPRESAETDRPPVPSLPTPPRQQKDGVMNRRRPPVLKSTSPSINPDQPIVISMSSPYMSGAFTEDTSPPPARTQLPSQKHPLPRTSSASLYSNSSRPESVWSTSKALPPPPTELSMVNDRVGYLNARLESLGNRRININQAIKQMTELMPTDSILASEAVLRKREAEKRKVEALKVELAEVQREEYEIGLKLHRAYKRMDRNAEYEPTTLWVRRVTG